jgi:hypothetical protein
MKLTYCCRRTFRDLPALHIARRATTQARNHDRKYFVRVVEQLKIHLPPSRPVVVQTGRQFSDKEGDCLLCDRRFRIRVSRQLNESQAIEVLIHEWAHALSWDVCVGPAAKSRKMSDHEFEWIAHGPKWGIAYSEVYRCFAYEIVPILRAEDLNADAFRGIRRRR